GRGSGSQPAGPGPQGEGQGGCRLGLGARGVVDVRRRARLTERALVLQRVVYAGLDSLRLVLAPDLCACLHAVKGQNPQLYLRSPDLATLSATEAFTLFSGLRDLLDTPDVGASGRSVAGYTTGARATWGEG